MTPQLIIHPDIQVRIQEIEKILSKNNLSQKHPNLFWIEDEKLGIEQARKIKEHLSLKPYQGKLQVVVITQADNLTTEAQNALLKTLEESPEYVLILLGISSEDRLLSTILSRCHLNYLINNQTQETASEKFQKKIEELINLSYEKRFQYIEKLEEKEEFLHNLTIYFRNILTKSTFPHDMWELKDVTKFLQDLMVAEKWAKQNVNIRAILEYLMLKMPIK